MNSSHLFDVYESSVEYNSTFGFLPKDLGNFKKKGSGYSGKVASLILNMVNCVCPDKVSLIKK
jgi:hypothetical protein